MLLQSPGSPLVGKQLVHIGERDPWRDYVPVEMGQWPLLLTLPAYTMRPSSSQYRLMDSPHFALITASQWIEHRRRFKFGSIVEKVISIVDNGTHFTLTLDSAQTIDASHVDICAGPGPARPIPAKLGATPILTSTISPKPLLYAEDYLHRRTS